MAPSVSTFWAPKAGSAAEEWEDAFCCDPQRGRFSVADGASESSFSARWAKLLAEGFVAEPPDGPNLREWLRPLQEEWARGMTGRTLPWYAEEKARSGAFSSLLGLRLDPGARVWRATAVGDSCLFAVRAGRLVTAFPLSRSSEFHNRPLLLSSVSRANEGVWSAVREAEGTLGPDDLLLLTTDALGAWFLAEAEMGRRPWGTLGRLGSQEEFETFVDLMRAGRSMRNDDVALVRIGEAP